MEQVFQTYIPLFGKTLNINAEYYYTDFLKQVVVDMDTAPHEVSFYNLDGRSYSPGAAIGSELSAFQGVHPDGCLSSDGYKDNL